MVNYLPIVNLTAALYAGKSTRFLSCSSFSNQFVKSDDQFGSTCNNLGIILSNHCLVKLIETFSRKVEQIIAHSTFEYALTGKLGPNLAA